MGDVTRRYLGEDVQSRALSPSGDHAAIATRDLLACVDRTGNELWRFEFGPVTGREVLSRSDCRYSLDGTVVWLYRPDDYAGRGDIDRWFALHAATGEVIGDAPLPTPGGHGASQFLHPDGIHILLDVGCGQDGSYLFKGWIDQGRMASTPWPSADAPDFGDQRIADVSEGGVMVFDHEGDEVAFLDFPSGTATWKLPLEDLGYDLETDRLETVCLWSGRYLDGRIAVVELRGETGEAGDDASDWAAAGLGELEEFTAYQAIDLQERRVIGPADADGSHTGRRPRFLPCSG